MKSKVFFANGKEYDLSEDHRNTIKSDWKAALLPAKTRKLTPDVYTRMRFLSSAEDALDRFGISLCGKDILEIGCGYGELTYLTAKYEGTKVHGIDVDEYIADQATDLNSWNPEDIEFVNKKWTETRNKTAVKFPKFIQDKVTFETCGIEKYVTPNPHDLIISWDVLEHIIDLPLAFNQMANAVKRDGIVYHEYNPFFSFNGGHSLCTLDFLHGHCRLSAKDFERYIREIRPEEEKPALNFYYKCLNRATIKEIKELAVKNEFEMLMIDGHNPYKASESQVREELTKTILPDVIKIYPDVSLEDLMWDSTCMVLRKK